MIALSKPAVSSSLTGHTAKDFSDVYVVVRPMKKPHRYASELPKAAAAVCGWVDIQPTPAKEPARRRFFATFAGKAGQPDDSQVAVSVEDNNPADLTQDGMERSARFMRGWRQYCVDAAHPE